MAAQKPLEFEYDGNLYQVGKMDMFSQTDLAAKLSPFVVPFLETLQADGTLQRLKDAGKDGMNKGEMMSMLLANVGKITSVVSGMKSEDRRFVMETCVSVVYRKASGAVGWQPVWNSDARCVQYEELDTLPFGLICCAKVVEAKLKGFFPTGL